MKLEAIGTLVPAAAPTDTGPPLAIAGQLQPPTDVAPQEDSRLSQLVTKYGLEPIGYIAKQVTLGTVGMAADLTQAPKAILDASAGLPFQPPTASEELRKAINAPEPATSVPGRLAEGVLQTAPMMALSSAAPLAKLGLEAIGITGAGLAAEKATEGTGYQTPAILAAQALTGIAAHHLIPGERPVPRINLPGAESPEAPQHIQPPPEPRPEPPPAIAPPPAPIAQPAPRAPPQPPAPAAPPPLPERPPSHNVYSAPTDALHLDAERFQYKGAADAEGVTGELAGTNQFDQFKAGPLDVWKDPANDKTYVVDGHQRYNLAKRSGTPQLNVQYLNDLGVETAQQARATAALHNIAQNPAYPGASIDAAKFFRDSGLTAADLEREGIPLNRAVAREGLGLAGLNDALFRKVQIAEMTPARGALIGRELPEHAQQTGLQRLLAGKNEVPDKVIAQLIRDVKNAPTTEGTQVDLFGASQLKQSLALERAKLTVDIRDSLAKDKRLFKFLADEQRAEEAKRGGNVLQVDANERIATAAKKALEAFEQQAGLKGPISEALNAGAKRYNQGEDFNAVRNDTLNRIREALPAFIPGLQEGGLAGVGGTAPEGPALFGPRPSAGASRPIPPVAPGILGSERGSVTLPDVITKPIVAAREMARDAGKWLQPTAFATDEQLNRLIGAKGENIEALRFQYEGLSKGNEKFFDKMIGKKGFAATDDYLQRLSTGQTQPTPELRRMADFHRQMLDAAALGASKYKTVPYLTDYVPGIFTRPEDAERWFNASGRRPMEGSKGFFKPKFWHDVIEATKPVAQGGGGLELVSRNPETLIRTYLEDVRKFTYARAWFEDAKKAGALKWVAEGRTVPEGWAKIDDAIVRRFFPKDQVPLVVAGQSEVGSVATQQFTPAGNWVAREGEARLVNNLHGEDWLRAKAWARGGLAMNAALNAIQLGLSGFHLQSEAFNSWSTMSGHAMSELANGRPLHALARLVRTPTAPLEYLYRGARMWNDPALRSSVLSELPGGFRADLNPLRHGMRLASPTGAFAPGSAWDTFKKLARRRSLRIEGQPHAAVHALFAPIDLASKPIFSYIVPRMKVGAYYDILGNEIRRNEQALVRGDIDIKTLARRAATAVDDRFGLVNYDAWFWNQNFKTAVQLLFRAPGWNVGYGREFGGGMWDMAHGQLSPRGQFLLGMIFTQVAAAALYQKFYTGKNIESLTDVIAPQDGGVDADGNPTRRRFANPLKDAGALAADGLINLGQSKMAPAPDAAVRLLVTNKDYFGDYIRNRHDPAAQQMRQVGDYLLSDVTPFSVSQFQRLQESQKNPLGAFIGTTAAPRSLIEAGGPTAAVRKIVAEHEREMGPRTREQVDMDRRKVQARREIATDQKETPILDKLVDEGVFGAGKQGRENLRHFYREANQTPSERLLQRLPKSQREEAQKAMDAVTH